VREWRQQFDKLESVDLRYERQIIVNPDLQGAVKQAPLSIASAKAAMAAGMKPAALITHQLMASKSAGALSPTSKPLTKVAAGKKTARKAHHKAAAKANPKTGAAFAQGKSTAKSNSPANQSSSTPSTAAAALGTSGKATSSASPSTGTVAAKPGSKPSPAIAKGEEHP
jgi:hypothetical protein